MKESQEPKYAAVADDAAHGEQLGGYLINRHTGQRIPDDEPVFVFRARDIHARAALRYYYSLINGGLTSHADAVDKRIRQFDDFAINNPERMKQPD